MRTFTDGDLTVKAFDTPVWAQERNLLHVHVEDVTASSRVNVYCAPYEATYKPDANGDVTINVSDLVRAYSSGTIKVTLRPAMDVVEIPFTNVGWLINPKHQIIPFVNDKGLLQAIGGTNGGKNILFPSVILKPIAGFEYRNLAELFIDTPEPTNKLYLNYGTGANLVSVGQLTNVFSNAKRYSPPYPCYLDVTTKVYPYTASDIVLRVPIINQELECNKRYACVQWVSRSGVIKRATWEVQKVTDNVADTYELLRDDNAYDVRKGQQTTLQLVLENLNDYDFWYYSDIITSSDVRIAMSNDDWDNSASQIAEENRVEVTDKKVQQIDGNAGKFNTLKVTVNYKRYDTI